jgi:hypothetical protein
MFLLQNSYFPYPTISSSLNTTNSITTLTPSVANSFYTLALTTSTTLSVASVAISTVTSNRIVRK